MRMKNSIQKPFGDAASVEIEVRQFRADEWAEFKRVRLLALAQDGSKFKFEAREELTHSDAQWISRVSDPDHCMVGAFIKATGAAVGLTIASISPSREELEIGSLWIDPAHRGKSLTMSIYATFFEWSKDKPDLKYVEISHRAGNKSTEALAATYGFTRHRVEKNVIWFDGAVADKIFYRWEIPRSLFSAAKPDVKHSVNIKPDDRRTGL